VSEPCPRSAKPIYLLLAAIGSAILVGDVVADISFFSDPLNRTPGLVGSAAVRNFLTLCAVIGLFFNKKWAAYVAILAAILGLVRRWSYLAPVFTLQPGDDFLLVHSGFDAAFRILLLGAGLGWFLRRSGEKS
jgi:hypothetical protein